MIIEGVWIGNWIYWPLMDRTYKQLLTLSLNYTSLCALVICKVWRSAMALQLIVITSCVLKLSINSISNPKPRLESHSILRDNNMGSYAYLLIKHFKKNVVSWDVAPCRSCVNRCFVGTYRFHLQGRKSASEELAWAGGCRLMHQSKTPSWFLARGFFYPEDGSNTFLRNVGSHKIFMGPHPRRRHSS
jgi:hypothetical protein